MPLLRLPPLRAFLVPPDLLEEEYQPPPSFVVCVTLVFPVERLIDDVRRVEAPGGLFEFVILVPADDVVIV